MKIRYPEVDLPLQRALKDARSLPCRNTHSIVYCDNTLLRPRPSKMAVPTAIQITVARQAASDTSKVLFGLVASSCMVTTLAQLDSVEPPCPIDKKVLHGDEGACKVTIALNVSNFELLVIRLGTRVQEGKGDLTEGAERDETSCELSRKDQGPAVAFYQGRGRPYRSRDKHALDTYLISPPIDLEAST